MCKYKNSKKLALCFTLTWGFLFLYCESGYCQKSGMHTRGSWQTSVNPGKFVDGKSYTYSASGRMEIGVRDKFGELGNYSATFVVTAPDKRSYKHVINVKGSDFGYTTFPDNFKASSLQAGIYAVKIYVKNQVVVAFKIKYTP